MFRRIIPALAAVLCLMACKRTPLQEAYRELDIAIAHRKEYQDAFERENDSLRSKLREAGCDSLRWEHERELFSRYKHYSIDSTALYVSRMKVHASMPVQKLRTHFAQVEVMEWMSDPSQALSLFRELDTTGMTAMGLKTAYLKLGVNVYQNYARFSSPYLGEENYADSLTKFRESLVGIDTLSYEGKKIYAQLLRAKKQYRKSLEVFLSCLPSAQGNWHEITSIEYNCSVLYAKLGDSEKQKICLARSGVADMHAPNRDLLSLYELALTLFREGKHRRAARYIQLHFEEVFAGGFRPKMLWSSRAYNIIIDASLRAERRSRLFLTSGITLVSVLLAVISVLWVFASRQSRKRAEALAKLEKANTALVEANKIKENYVFRYMDLSIKYLDKAEEERREYRQIAKNKGEQALLKILRAPTDFSDYKEFYRIFDQTFLGIFPDFVKDVNSLLKEDARFDESAARITLPTELRILATIKLGIEDSPRISSFLKCSLSTVYTYRARMRNQAICPKEEFEEMVKNL